MTPTTEIEVKSLDFFYSGEIHALQKISFPIYKNKVTALIGPSGCGKTTLLRCFNRMHDLYPKHRYEGEILFQDKNILASDIDLINLRSRVGMVFQKPTPFPMSIAENIAYGLRLKGIKNKSELVGRIEEALKHAALRRAWSADPAIRDYIGPAEYAWDFTDPKAMPGFGDLGPDVDVKRLVAEVFRGMAPEGESPADTPAPAPSSAQPARLSDKSDTVADIPAANEPATAQPERLVAAPEPNELVQHGRNIATQQDSTKVESPDVKIRRHGGAMPE